MQYPTQMYSNKRSCVVIGMGIHIGSGTSSLTRVGIQFQTRVGSIRHGKFIVTGAGMQYRTQMCSIACGCAVMGVEINEFSCNSRPSIKQLEKIHVAFRISKLQYSELEKSVGMPWYLWFERKPFIYR